MENLSPQDPQPPIEVGIESLSLAEQSPSRDTATENPPPQQRTLTSFMDLPAELRIMIYEYALPSRASLSTRIELTGENTSSDPSHISRLTHLNDMALLCASRAIHHEALETLYKDNHFHHYVDVLMAPSTTPFSPHMYLMQHITLDFDFHVAYHQRVWNFPHIVSIDNAISSQLQTIAANCRQLQIFELRLISSRIDGLWDIELQGAILNSLSIPAALAAVAAKVRYRLSIWLINDGVVLVRAPQPDEAWRRLREAVAGGEHWTRHWRMLNGPSVAGVDPDHEAVEWRCMMGGLRRAAERKTESESRITEGE